MRRHIIVSGDDSLATTIVEELNNAGEVIVKLTNPGELADAGVDRAVAVVCAGDDDAVNLEIALLARKANPNVRVVARLANDVLRGAVAAAQWQGLTGQLTAGAPPSPGRPFQATSAALSDAYAAVGAAAAALAARAQATAGAVTQAAAWYANQEATGAADMAAVTQNVKRV